ncbi:MAG TPA: DUF4389 domain-containing protein [Capillimicrobium sp.]|nr:DUF4389 domain-containing protein [Capillimicrobium sp.]
MSIAPHPIQIRVRDPSLQRNRWTVAFRLILAIPQLIWWCFWSLGMALLLPVAWIATLILGRLPDWAHEVYERYVRFNVHLGAYIALAANDWPGFIGDRGYAVDVDIAPPARQNRWTVAFRLVLWLPPYLLASLLGFWAGGGGGGGSDVGASSDPDGWDVGTSIVGGGGGGLLTLVAVLAWFAILVKGSMPRGFRDVVVFCLGYSAQVAGYLALLTGRYPNSTPALSHPAAMPPHPVTAALDDDRRRSRLTTFFRALLVVPHLVWLVLWGIVVVLAAIANWFATLAMGRSPEPLHRFLAAYVRYYAHVLAFLFLATNPFPGFVGQEGGYPFDVRIAPPARQHRAKTLFRVILVIPASMVSSALASVRFAAAIGGWFAGVFTARMPEGLRDLSAWATRYDAQVMSYLLLLTDRYPDSAPTLEVGEREREPEPLHPPQPAAATVWEPPSPDWGRGPEAIR